MTALPSLVHEQKGQALLIVVLVIVVALTVALSLASRSITNLRTTTDEANSQKAFSAAEAGVEQAVKNGKSITTAIDLGNNSQISQVTVADITGGSTTNDEFILNNGNPIFQNDGMDIWLSPHEDDPTQLFKTPWGCGAGFNPSDCGAPQTLTVNWGTQSAACADPALEILIISGSSRTTAHVSKYAFDACSGNRHTINNFSTPALGSFQLTNNAGLSKTFNYRAQITITNGLLARVIPLYASGVVGVRAVALPPQGKMITSTGIAGSSDSQVSRKVTFFEGYNTLPSELFYSIFQTK